MKVVLLLFSHGEAFVEAKNRLKAQAERAEFFDEIIDIDTINPPEYFYLFLKENDFFFNVNTRGFGNWLWKPFLIKYALNNLLNSGDILVYLDSGCEISSLGGSFFKKYIEIANKYDALFFSTGKKEKYWTKRDLFERLNIDYSTFNNTQIQATFLFLKNTDTIKKMTDKWLNLAIENNYRYIDDSPSVMENDICFNEHRHDQSILSLLLFKTLYPIIKMNMCFDKLFYSKNSYVLLYPIHAIRNKDKESVLNSNILVSNFNSATKIASYLKYNFIRISLYFKRKLFQI